MVNDASHDQLILLAKQFLLRRGFSEDRIFTEVPVLQKGQVIQKNFWNTNYTMQVRRGIISDVVGLKDNYAIAVECGHTPSERLEQLRLMFDEVVYLPFVTMAEALENTASLHSEIDRLKQRNEQLEADLRETDKKYRDLAYQLKLLLPRE